MNMNKINNLKKDQERYQRQRLFGKVVSDAMDKTVVILVESFKAHPKYKKRYKVSKRYQAHDPKNFYKVGDLVEVVHARPYSKNKRFRVRYTKEDKE